MKHYVGSGSQASPIFIDDDEIEEEELSVVGGQLLDREPFAIPRSKSAVSHHSQRRTQKSSAQSLEKHEPLDRDSNERQAGENALKTRKRKREQYDLQDDATTSGLMHSLPPAPSLPASKSKRTKRQERVSSRSGNKVTHYQVFDDAAFDVDPLPLDPDTYSPISSLDASVPSAPMPGDIATLSVQTSSFPSSEWVNSMVKAAHPPDIQNLPSNPWNDFVDSNTSRPWLADLEQSPTWPSRSFSSIPSTILSKKSVQIPLSARSSGSNAPATSSKKPPFTNIIGMPYAKDPEGKRGEFKLSSNTVVESKPHITYPHSPDPSRSLIMDQLPKLSRTVQWLKSWAQDACGTQPVFLAIDSSSAKALVEFSTIDQAEKAWSSPKLGKGLSSLSPTALKGKPRVDLIKVWWYRSPSPELMFTRKELEEGEIEDDEYTVDGRKESKKEKRARLARMAKDEKQKELVNSLVKSRGHSNMPPSIGSSDSMVGHTYASNNKQPLPPAPLSSVINAPPLAPISLSMASHNDSSTQLEYHVPSTAAKPDIRDIDDRLSGGPLTAHHHPGRIFTMDVGISLSSGKQNDANDIESSFLAVQSPPLTPSPLLEENIMSARQSSVRKNSPILTVHPVLHPNSPSSVVQTISRRSSAVKRSLLARQKELERRIALSKQEIGWKKASAGELSDTGMQLSVEQTSSLLSPSLNSFQPPPPSFETPSEPQSDKQAMEVHLRRLVLASQKKKSNDSDPFRPFSFMSETIIGHDKPLRIDPDVIVPPDLVPSDDSSGTRTPSTTAGTAYDDLAVSFIEESIKAAKPTFLPLAPPASAVKPQPSRLELAARREQLEYQIAETKRLMGLLSQTTTKQGRDNIMTQIRERNRSQKQLSSELPTPNLVHTPSYPSFIVKPIEPSKSLWPESIPDGGIFILSEDEEDDDDDDDDDKDTSVSHSSFPFSR